MRFMLTYPLIIASAAFLHVAPLPAAEPIKDVRPVSVAEWVKQVNRELDRSMPVGDNPTGLVIVTFRVGADGYPAAVRVHDARPSLRAAALETLRRAHQLPPLPHGVNPDQRIKLLLLFAGDENLEVYTAKRRAMTESAETTNRMFDVKLASTEAKIASSR